MHLDASLQELEGSNWGEPDEAPSNMVARCLRLRRVPVRDLTREDIRLLLNQNVGVKYLLPIAMPWLREDPGVEIEYFPGDLLSAVARLDTRGWVSVPTYKPEIIEMVRQFLTRADIDNFLRSNLEGALRKLAP